MLCRHSFEERPQPWPAKGLTFDFVLAEKHSSQYVEAAEWIDMRFGLPTDAEVEGEIVLDEGISKVGWGGASASVP